MSAYLAHSPSAGAGALAWFIPFLIWVLVTGTIAVCVVLAVAGIARRWSRMSGQR